MQEMCWLVKHDYFVLQYYRTDKPMSYFFWNGTVKSLTTIKFAVEIKKIRVNIWYRIDFNSSILRLLGTSANKLVLTLRSFLFSVHEWTRLQTCMQISSTSKKCGKNYLKSKKLFCLKFSHKVFRGQRIRELMLIYCRKFYPPFEQHKWSCSYQQWDTKKIIICPIVQWLSFSVKLRQPC